MFHRMACRWKSKEQFVVCLGFGVGVSRMGCLWRSEGQSLLHLGFGGGLRLIP